jgi:tRNA pseudouridine38-40 synthase
MRLACDPFIGEHDFSSFCRKVPDRSPVRTVHRAEWDDLGDDLLRFEITANAFCQQMVRAIVGTLVGVGHGRRHAGHIAAILRARDRAFAGALAPPHGLLLWRVDYAEPVPGWDLPPSPEFVGASFGSP